MVPISTKRCRRLSGYVRCLKTRQSDIGQVSVWISEDDPSLPRLRAHQPGPGSVGLHQRRHAGFLTTRNAHRQCLHRSLPRALPGPDTDWFLTLADTREKLEKWRRYHNQDGPHGAIGNTRQITLMTPGDAPSRSPRPWPGNSNPGWSREWCRITTTRSSQSSGADEQCWSGRRVRGTRR